MRAALMALTQATALPMQDLTSSPTGSQVSPSCAHGDLGGVLDLGGRPAQGPGQARRRHRGGRSDLPGSPPQPRDEALVLMSPPTAVAASSSGGRRRRRSGMKRL